MAIKPGDRGHVAEHNLIDTRLDALEALPPGTSDAAVAGFVSSGPETTAALDAATAALVPDSGTATGAALSAAYAPKDNRVGTIALPSGATLTPLPTPLNNTFRQNLVAFIVDNVTTVGKRQLAIWVNAESNPVVGLRNLGEDDWEVFDLSTIPGNPMGAPDNGDGHNDYVIAVDSDGFIHVSGDMHAMELHYVRSTAPWKIDMWEAPGMVGTDEDTVSYPQFVHRLSGELLFVYREGADGVAAVVVNAYDTGSRSWSRRSIPLDGRTGTLTSTPYINRPAVGPDDSLHLFNLWRDTGGPQPPIGHLRSLDGGTTWSRMDGSAVAIPVTRDDAEAEQIAFFVAANQQGADVDANGNPHASFVSTKGFGVDIRHVYWSGAAWVTEDVIDQSAEAAGLTRAPRASLFCRGAETYLIYTVAQTGFSGGGGQSLRIRNLAANDRHVDFALVEANLGQYEPTFDQLALRERDELVMLITTGQPEAASTIPVNLPKYVRAWGGILRFPLSLTRMAAGLDDRAPRNERSWIPATAFMVNEGAPTLSLVNQSPAWLLPDAATTSVVGLVHVPERWQAVNVDLWWANGGAATGAVKLTTILNRALPDVALATNTSPTTAGVTATAGAIGVPVVTRAVTARSIVPYDTDRLMRILVRRSGLDAASDTLAANAVFLGVMLSPTLLP